MVKAQQGRHCTKCGVKARYVSGHSYGYWVHTDTGQCMSMVNGRHDVNTHISPRAK